MLDYYDNPKDMTLHDLSAGVHEYKKLTENNHCMQESLENTSKKDGDGLTNSDDVWTYNLTRMGLSRFHVTKNKIVQYWSYLYYSYVWYIGNRSRQVDDKHDAMRTTHMFHLHNRGNCIQRQARFNTVSTQTQKPITDRWISWDLYSRTQAIDRAGLPLHQKLPVQYWYCWVMTWVGSVQTVSRFTSNLANVRTLRYTTLNLDELGKGGLASCPTNFNCSKIFFITSFIDALQLGLVAKKQGFPKRCPTIANSWDCTRFRVYYEAC